MQEILAQIREYLLGIWRYRWLALAVAVLVSAAGWTWVARMPEEYRATARVYVDTNQVLKPLLKGLAVDPNTKQRIAILSRTMLSRPNLEKLMRMADLDLEVNTPEEKEALLSKLRHNIHLGADPNNRSLYLISFQNPDRKLAKLMVQSLLSIFVEGTLGEKREETEGAQEFLEQQIKDYEQRLIAAETRLMEFRQKHLDDLTGSVEDYYKKLQEAKQQAKAVRLQLQEMENRKRELERQLEDAEAESEGWLGDQPYADAGPAKITTSLDPRIAALETRLDELRLKYTDKHPQVRQLKAMLKDLRRERAREIQQLARRHKRSGPAAELKENPVYQQLQAMLAETDARIAELKIRDQNYADQVKRLEGKLESIPKVQAALKQLNRDYKVLASRHQKLIERRESVYISGEVEKKSENVKFKVIDPPYVPLEPTEPNKLLLNAGVLVAALGLGAGLAFLMALLRPVFLDPRSLARVTGLPVLGVVSLVRSPEQIKRERLATLAFSVALVVWLSAFVMINVVERGGLQHIKQLIKGVF